MSVAGAWTGVLGPPIVWFIFLQVNYILATSACLRTRNSALAAVAAAAILLSAAAGVAAWRSWRTAGASSETEQGGLVVINRFIALLGLGMSAFFILLLIASAIPIFVFQTCE